MPELLRGELNDDWFGGRFRTGRGMAVFDELQFLRFILVEPGHFLFQHERDEEQPVKNRAEGQRRRPRRIEVESAKINYAPGYKSGDGNRQQGF